MKRMLFIFQLICGLSVANSVLAFSAFATVKGHAGDSLAYSYNYGSQKEADISAVDLCRETAREKGIGHLAKQCAVVLRGKAAGFGAFTCGDDGCAYVTDHESSQEAVDAAFDLCNQNFQNCNGEKIKFGEDYKGFSKQRVNNVARNNKSCIPNTSRRSCQSQCMNGDCIVTYQNGCKVRVQVSPQFNPMNNSWDYPSPGC